MTGVPAKIEDGANVTQGENDDLAVAVEEPAVAAGDGGLVDGGGGLGNFILPLESLVFRVPEYKDPIPGITECVQETMNECVLDLTWDITFHAANVCARDGRKVITEEDMKRTLEMIMTGQTDAGTSLRERLNIVRERHNRATAQFHPYERTMEEAVDEEPPPPEASAGQQ